MGQNMIGWLEIKINAPKGFETVIEHGEILLKNKFYNKNNRSALQQFRYISDGNESIVHPHFTYFGFRYVRLTKSEGPVNIDDLVGCVVYSDLKIIGHLETGKNFVNKLFDIKQFVESKMKLFGCSY